MDPKNVCSLGNCASGRSAIRTTRLTHYPEVVLPQRRGGVPSEVSILFVDLWLALMRSRGMIGTNSRRATNRSLLLNDGRGVTI
jgi:hypothetical protein